LGITDSVWVSIAALQLHHFLKLLLDIGKNHFDKTRGQKLTSAGFWCAHLTR
jgi:hypothetical protein